MTMTTSWTSCEGDETDALTAEHSMPRMMFDIDMAYVAQAAIADSLELALDRWISGGSVSVQVRADFEDAEVRLERTYAREADQDLYAANATWAGELVAELDELATRFPDHPVAQVSVVGCYSDERTRLELASAELHGPDGDSPLESAVRIPWQRGQPVKVTVHALDASNATLVDFDVTLEIPEDITQDVLLLVVSPTRLTATGEETVTEQYARAFEAEVEHRTALASEDTEDDFFVGIYYVDEDREDGQIVIVDQVRAHYAGDDPIVPIGPPIISQDSGALLPLSAILELEP
jgi:hypothetical protein